MLKAGFPHQLVSYILGCALRRAALQLHAACALWSVVTNMLLKPGKLLMPYGPQQNRTRMHAREGGDD